MSLLAFWSSVRKPVVGMLHLPPLPGSPGSASSGRAGPIDEAVLRDAQSLADGGVHALMLENFGDVPFYPGRVPAHTVAAMTAIAAEVRRRFPELPLGINVLRNDGCSALAIATAVGAQFIRVNVLCGARLADQGILQGIAHDLLRDRAMLRAEHVRIFADVDVKHSAPLAAVSIESEVEDTLKRGLADALVVSGTGTGKATDPAHVARACQPVRAQRGRRLAIGRSPRCSASSSPRRPVRPDSTAGSAVASGDQATSSGGDQSSAGGSATTSAGTAPSP